MKRFFKQFTHDAYYDWFVVLVTAAVALVALAGLSLVEFQKVHSIEIPDAKTATSTVKTIDTKRLDELLDQYNEKKIRFEKGEIEKVDARDPSV